MALVDPVGHPWLVEKIPPDVQIVCGCFPPCPSDSYW